VHDSHVTYNQRNEGQPGQERHFEAAGVGGCEGGDGDGGRELNLCVLLWGKFLRVDTFIRVHTCSKAASRITQRCTRQSLPLPPSLPPHNPTHARRRTYPVRPRDEYKDVGYAEYEEVAAASVTPWQWAARRVACLKQCVSQPLLTGPHISLGVPQNESIRV